MYAPDEGDEWIELFNDVEESIDLSGWNLSDNKATDQLVCCFFVENCSLIIEPDNYALITDQDTTLYEYLETEAVKICVDDSRIGNNLGNTEDIIRIYGSNYSIEFLYDKSMGAHNNNRTLERRTEDTWGESLVEGGTPGEENSIFELSTDYSSLMISEIFPDPFEADDALKPRGEWVEIYNSGEEIIYLGGLEIKDQDDDNELIIADNKVLDEDGLFLYPDEFVVVYRDGDSDFALNNNGYEEVRLFAGEELIHEVTYTTSTSGMSWSNLEGDYYLTPPTPGEMNEIIEDCDWLLLLDLENSIYQGEDFSLDLYLSRFYGMSGNVTVKGQIEDQFGEVIKEYSPWTNVLVDSDRSKTYTPNLADGVYQISFWFDSLDCNDLDESDNYITQLISINPEYQAFDSYLAIDHVYLGSDNKAEWGDQFTVKVFVHKGNTTKTAIELWAEKDDETVSKRSKLNVYDQFKPYTLTLPLQLDPNCANEEAEDGDVTLIFEGLGERAETTFKVEGIDKEICKDYAKYIKEKEKENKQKISYHVVDLPSSIRANEILPLKVQLINEDQEHQYKVWTYLYRGSKCYSCQGKERDGNLQQLTLQDEEVRVLDFLLKLDPEMEPGEYKIKIKINKDNQKTNKELTKSIYIEEPTQEELVVSEQVFVSDVEGGNDSLQLGSKKRRSIGEGIIVYQSNSQKAKNLIPYILLVTFGLLCLVLILKKD